MNSETILQDGTKIDEGEKVTGADYIEIEIPCSLYEYLSADHCNVQNMCRICLATENEILYPLVATKENSVLAHMFTAFTTVQLLSGDGLPSSICEPCQAQVVQSYEFKTKCEKSDCMLKSLLKGEFVAKEENISDHSMDIKQEKMVEDNMSGAISGDIYLNDIIDVKQEAELLEDVQYLEDLSDNSGELCIVQNKRKTKKKFIDGKGENSSFLNVSNKKLRRKAGKLGKNDKSFTCRICSKKFQNLKAFHAHMKSKHPSTRHLHFCNQCTEMFNSEHDLKLHAAIHSKGNTWKCNQCPKEFRARAMLRRHISRHMESKRFSCEVCGKAFTEQYALRRHARVHTGEILEKKHACTICDKRYSESGLLTAHMSRHIGLRPCECSICGKRFPSNRLLASHRLVHSDRKPYACQYCEKRFRHESTRNTHHRTHTGEKPYVCSVCGKSFIQNSNLTLHMRTHTGERPYSCSVCDRKFTSSSSLKSHERIHSGERPFSCDICGKSFTRKNLNAHMRNHSGERPYECSVCSKKFANATRLRDHHRVHTGEKPFDCSMCSQKFATKSQQLKHSKTHQKKKRAQLPDKDREIKKERENRGLVILQQVEPISFISDRVIFEKDHGDLLTVNENVLADESPQDHSKELTLDIVQEVPLEVTGELVLQDESNMKELLVVDNSQTNNYQGETICLNTSNVNIIDDVNYEGDNLVTVNEGGVSISTANLEGTTVKLYQLDQSLVQIHSSGGQVTISKITSKMTANF